MILKLKALVYRYTGIYLASREELAYLESEKFWKEMAKSWSKKDGFSPRSKACILLGLWQCDHGFFRAIWTPALTNRNFFYKVIEWFVVFFKTAKWDLYELFYMIKARKNKLLKKPRKKKTVK